MSLTAEDAVRVAELKQQIHYENIMGDLNSTLSDTYIGAERIRDVVQNLRLFSRLDEAEIKRVDLHEGLEATIRLLSRYFKPGRITVTRDYGDLPPVTCYAAQLNQVWMNLLVNAAQAIGDDVGTVHIQSRCDRDRVVISINDSGRGISEENRKKIFDPFFTTKPIGEGTGLGLSITHGIIVQHHGTINIESAAGKGTTFVITLPIEIEPTFDE
jgi:two-component system NtrC family sensor kinase